MDKRELLNNIIDELTRAKERIKEIGEFEDITITSDEELVNDIEITLERLYDVI